MDWAVLCLDVGNTTLHAGRVAADGAVENEWEIATASVRSRPELLHARLADAIEPGLALASCSVVPEADGIVEGILAAVGWNGPRFQLTEETCPLPIHYPRPREIGADRLAAAVAAQALVGAPAAVIDLGTAATIDAVSPRGYEGGLIAPGLGVMTRYLHEQTALLPALDEEELAVAAGIGKSTRQAMRVGCAHGFAGMLEALHRIVVGELEQPSPRPVSTVVTGASAGLLPRSWLTNHRYVRHLTLLGLAQAAQGESASESVPATESAVGSLRPKR